MKVCDNCSSAGGCVLSIKKYVALPIVAGITVGLLADELLGEGNPHAEFVAVSPTSFSNISMGTSTVNVVVYDSEFSNFTPVEWKIPQQRAVVQTAGLVLPPKEG